MAGDYIKWSHGLERKPKMIAVAAALKVAPVHAAGICLTFWVWCDLQAAEEHQRGDDLLLPLPGAPEVIREMIDGRSVTDCPGFCAALETVGWLKLRPSRIEVPRFFLYVDETAKSRAIAREKKRAQRRLEQKAFRLGTQMGTRPDVVPGQIGTEGGTRAPRAEQSRAAESREEKSREKAAAGADVPPTARDATPGAAASEKSAKDLCSMLLLGVPGMKSTTAAALAKIASSEAHVAWAIERTQAAVADKTARNPVAYCRSLVANESPTPAWVAEWGRRRLAVQGMRQAAQDVLAAQAAGGTHG